MDVWCIGDLHYFVAVLNGLAMLSNAGIFNDLVKVGIIVAVLLLGFQAIFQTQGAGGVPWGKFILAFIAFKFFFGSTTTLYVHDTYSLQEQSVDNVPYGVAVAASILSKVGHEITVNLEQAFALPNMTEQGFGAPLEVLTKGRKFAVGLDALHQGRVTRTLVEYADKCTSTGINKGELNAEAIKVAPDPWNAMRWVSDIYYATTWLPSDPAGGTLRTCTEAWEQIDNYLRGQLWSDWNDFLSAQICIHGQGTCDPVATVQDALDNLAGSMENDARNYMLAAVLLPAFEQGQIEFNSFMGKPEMAVVVGQAREQRNAQWMAEGSLFMNVARPMMAFFEGFLYAITPFMALLVAFVPAGLGLVGKYLMMFVWVQLWMPVMAILNHYLQIVAQSRLAALIDGNIPLTSLQGHLMGSSALMDWLGTAGVLVASTPAISLALLFGGAITMTHLAGRLQSGDFVSEKIVRPDVAQPAPVMSLQPSYVVGDVHGFRATGAEGVVPKLEVSEMASQAVQSSEARMLTAQQSFREAVGTMAAHSALGGYGLSHQAQSSFGLEARSGEKYGSIDAFSHVIGKDLGLSQTETQTLSGILKGGIGADGASLSWGASLRSQFDSAKAQQIQDKIQSVLDLSGNKSLQAAIDEKMASMATDGSLYKYDDIFKMDDIRNVERSAQELRQAQLQYSETRQFAARYGLSQAVPLTVLGQQARDMMGETPEQYLSRHNGIISQGKVNEAYQKYKQFTPNPEQAKWMAIFDTLHQQGKRAAPGVEGVRSEASRDLLMKALDRMQIPMTVPETGDAGRYQDVVDAGRIRDAGAQAARDAMGLPGPGDVPGRIEGYRRGLPGPQGSQAVERFYDGRSAEIRRKQEEARLEGARRQYQQTLDDIERHFDRNRSWSQTFLQGAMGVLTGIRTSSPILSHILGDKQYSPEPDPSTITAELSKIQPTIWQRYFSHGKALGLEEDMARLYAAGAMKGLAIAAHEYLGVKLPQMQDVEPARNAAIQTRAELHRERGMSPEEARRTAEQEVRVVELSGQTGMDGWAQRVVQGDSLFSQAAEARYQMAPSPRQRPTMSGLSGTKKQFAMGVHGEAAKSPYITGASLEGLRPEFLRPLKAMAQEYYHLTGKPIQVTDAFRTYEQQVELKLKKGLQAATPGRSMHGYGLAVDISADTANDLARRGLLAKYGFDRPIAREPWHLELAQNHRQLAKQTNPIKPKIM